MSGPQCLGCVLASRLPPKVLAVAIGLTPTVAVAAPAEASADASVDTAGASADVAAKDDDPARRKDRPWIKRWAPERNMVELGVFGGIMLPSPRLELFEPDFARPDQGFQQFARVAPDVGLRLGYYPSRFFGLEAEGAAIPTTTVPGAGALLWAGRGHLVGQIGLWSVVPFVVAGASGLGVTSQREAVGNDVDLGFHFGGGLKFFLSRRVLLRLDVRDTLTARRGVGESVAHSVEVLLGLSLTFGRKKDKRTEPADRDGDGILDADDKCIDEPGVPEYDGCPVPDTDGDGIADPDDDCVDEPGVEEYNGCPIPDTDGDGVLDPDDDCVDEPGVEEYRGCPIPDTDGDGILDPDDACVDEPETPNGFKDKDGCPDEVPDKVKKFTGAIDGIYFDTGKATIKKKSRAKLDAAVDVLKEYPNVRLEISGHTDNQGQPSYNMDLSRRRAEAVKAYFVGAGIDGERVETRGAGETEPVATNKTRKGRAANRRIEFKLLRR